MVEIQCKQCGKQWSVEKGQEEKLVICPFCKAVLREEEILTEEIFSLLETRPEEAVELLKKAASQGSCAACVLLADRYEAEKEYKEAAIWWKKAAENGEAFWLEDARENEKRAGSSAEQ